VLARGLGVRIGDLVTLLNLAILNPKAQVPKHDPFQVSHPGPTLEFIELARLVIDSGMSLPTLDYLFRHEIGPAQGPAPAESTVIQAVMKVWEALRAVREETEVVDDPDGKLLSTRLSKVAAAEVVDSVLKALDPAGGLDHAARARILADALGPYLDGAEQEVLASPDPETTDVVGQAARRLSNQRFVLVELSEWVRRSLSESAVVSTLAGTLGLADSLTRRLLVDWIPANAVADNEKPALVTFLALAGGDVDVEYFADPGMTGASRTAKSSAIDHRVTAKGPRSARWKGNLLPLGEGEHEFVLRTDGVSRLRLDGQSFSWDTVERDEAQRPIAVDRKATVALSANTLTSLEVEFESASAGSIELLWKLASAPSATPVAAEYLFLNERPDLLKAAGRTWRLLHKAALLINGLSLTEEELDYCESKRGPAIVEHPRFAGFHLRDLPMTPGGDLGPEVHMRRWQALAEYAAVRSTLPQAETTLVGVLKSRAPAGTDSERFHFWTRKLCDATAWDRDAVRSLFESSAVPADECSARLKRPISASFSA
jgi:hypothetical protein